MATVYIPSLMRDVTSGQVKVQVPGLTVLQIIENLEQAYPGIKERLVENNRIRSSISVAVDGEITPLGMLEKVGENSEVQFVPAIAGGDGPA
ncbi:MAG: MoaD/ThiS family protein [Dehalococcoidia bacterium]